jgi:hypothetical protein
MLPVDERVRFVALSRRDLVRRASSSSTPSAVMASSFAREKFLWLNHVRADPDLTPLAFMLAYVLSDLVNEREGAHGPASRISRPNAT